MRWKILCWLVLLCVWTGLPWKAGAQSLQGKIIYISHSHEVMLKFRSIITNFKFTNLDAGRNFETRITNDKNFSINSTVRGFAATNLIISEGSNTHLFILKYKESLDGRMESLYDFSARDKLKEEARKIQVTPRVVDPPVDTLPQQPINTVEDKPQPPVELQVSPPINTTQKTDASLKKAKEQENRQYASAIKKGKAAMAKEDYLQAKAFYQQAKELKPAEKLPVSELMIIETRLLELNVLARYESLVRIADSTAWIARNYPLALQWYDSAWAVKPGAAYPRKQQAAIKQIMMENDRLQITQQRSRRFNIAMEDFRKADLLRLDRKYEDAYKGYSAFLGQIDTLHLNEYLRAEVHYINQAKDYIARLDSYKPKPKKDTVIAPVEKSRRKKKKGKSVAFILMAKPQPAMAAHKSITLYEMEAIRHKRAVCLCQYAELHSA
jgi:tetratricopeptide (TPR) repeat protein